MAGSRGSGAPGSAARRRHPAGVYWRRRLFVLGLVAAVGVLVFGVVRGPQAPVESSDAAALVGEPVPPQPAPADPDALMVGPEPGQPSDPGTAGPEGPEPADLVEPDGFCENSDVRVVPVVGRAVAGQGAVVELRLRTETAEACTWRVGPNALAVKVTDGGLTGPQVWTSVDCRRLVPREQVVVRRDVTSVLAWSWGGRRSQLGCPAAQPWADPGRYTMVTAALGGEPGSADFRLLPPVG